MNKRVVLLKGMLGKSFALLKRYGVNTLARVFTLYFLFLLMFFGGRAVAGPALTGSTEGLVIGFFLFTMTVISFSGIAQNLNQEAQWGTLEQLSMTPFGLHEIVSYKAAINLFWSVVWGSLILVATVVTTGTSLQLPVVTVLVVGILGLVSVVGVGIALAGLVLLYKRIEGLFQLLNFAFVGLIAAPVESVPAVKILPVTLASHLIQRAMKQGTNLWDMETLNLALLVAVAVAYFAIGHFVFYLCYRRARRLDVIGDY